MRNHTWPIARVLLLALLVALFAAKLSFVPLGWSRGL
jgi:hypothetical protein